MIHSKLKKGSTHQVMIEFSTEKLPKVLEQFYAVCIDESVRTNKTLTLQSDKIRFYELNSSESTSSVKQSKKQQLSFGNVELKNPIYDQTFKFSVIYINQEDYQLQSQPAQRTILLRETLQSFFSIHYEIQNTVTEQESLIYLCSLVSSIINCKHEGAVELFDQRRDKLVKKGQQQGMTETQIVWKNIIFQTPGVGREKCEAIVKQFPTFEHILNDFHGDRQLKNVKVERGAKQTKIGKAIADKLYRIFTSINGQQLVN